MAIDQNRLSSLLDLLPAVFREDGEGSVSVFLGRFLLGFEQLLLGLGEQGEPGLEEVIAGIARYFDPLGFLTEAEARLSEQEKRARLEARQAPEEFLPWLAGWLALTLRQDWDPQRQRNLIARAAELYRRRGTKRGIEDFVSIYTQLPVTVTEFDEPFQLGVHSTVGDDTRIEGGPPFFFHVNVLLPTPDVEQRQAQLEVARAIIELQKPAHTNYSVTVESEIIFELGVHSTVGKDTLIGEDESPRTD